MTLIEMNRIALMDTTLLLANFATWIEATRNVLSMFG